MEANNLKKELIPKGMYCDGCPYFSYVSLYDDLGEIRFPYCIYLKVGSMPNGTWKLNEYERIQKLLNQTADELLDYESDGLLHLDLLWDGCKECGINDELDERDFE